MSRRYYLRSQTNGRTGTSQLGIPGTYRSTPAIGTDDSSSNASSAESEISVRATIQNSGPRHPTYSQVAALNTPSNGRSGIPEVHPDASNARETVADSSNIFVDHPRKDVTPPETSEVGPSVKLKTEDEDDGLWQEVRRGKHRTRNGKGGSSGSEASLGEGTSDLKSFRKGKAVDASAWVSLGIDPAELDPDAQRRELAAYSPVALEPQPCPEPAEISPQEREMDLVRQIEALEREIVRLRLESPAATPSDRGVPAGLPSEDPKTPGVDSQVGHLSASQGPLRSATSVRTSAIDKGKRRTTEPSPLADKIDLFLQLGLTVSEESKVEKLWYGLRPTIQAELWRAKLNPATSTWAEVQSEAEVAEIVLAVSAGVGRPGRQHDSPPARTSGPHPRGDHGRSQTVSRPSRSRSESGNGTPRSVGGTSTSGPQRPNQAPRAKEKLSKTEQDELRAAGKCYNCREAGHLARNCPKLTTVKSKGPGKPPGLASYSLEVASARIDDLRSLAETTARVESVEFNCVSIVVGECPDNPDDLGFNSSNSDRESDEPPWLCPMSDIGDDTESLPSLHTVNESDLAQSELSSRDEEDPILTMSWGELLTAQQPGKDFVHSEAKDTSLGPGGIHSSAWTLLASSSELWEGDSGDQGQDLLVPLELPQRRRDGRRRSTLGDVFEDQAASILQRNAPYFSEESSDGGTSIMVFSRDENHVSICYEDHRGLTKGGSFFPTIDGTIALPRVTLEDEEFDVVLWFRDQLRLYWPEEGEGPITLLAQRGERMGDAFSAQTAALLNEFIPWPTDMLSKGLGDVPRFKAFRYADFVLLEDAYLGISCEISISLLRQTRFDLLSWYSERTHERFRSPECFVLEGELASLFNQDGLSDALELNASSPTGAPPPIERNAASTRDFRRVIPEPIVVVVTINGQPARTLLDSGSLADFMSTKFAHQLGVPPQELEKPLPVQLAVQGSRAKVSCGCKAELQYQNVKETRYFDLMNLLNYDLILGTPFLTQHRMVLGFNPPKVVVGSAMAVEVPSGRSRTIASRAADVLEDELDKVRDQLRAYAAPICQDTSDAPFPPLRDINHSIPLKDPSKVLHWRPSKCPDALRPLWIEKRDAYLASGRWQMTSARNTSPMLLLKKPGTGVNGVPPRLRVVCDLRERNANTVKVTSPLPDMEGILRRLARKPYRSLIDGKDAYEQIRIAPEHVERTAMTTPDGNMVSLVLQQGDCNAVATYQSLMNHIFGPYIGKFMDVYLDDIAIYSDTVADHVKHCQMVIDILKKEQLYLSSTKLKFLCEEMKVLGRIVDRDGIRMDPNKVDSVLNWKVPTSRELVRGFLGSVGYLADDIATIRIPMGVLSSLTGSEVSFRWGHTEQRAFEEIKHLVHAHRTHHRVPLDYAPDAPSIWLVTDGSVSGIAGVVAQGNDWRTARVAAFFSAKLTSAQSNYAVHEIEMLAGVESMLRHRDVLLGCHFTWVTDHRGLIHLMAQKTLSGRQARWIEKISEFDFTIEYVPGVENVLADALSRIYSADAPGTVRAASEYVVHDDGEILPQYLATAPISTPVLAGAEASALMAMELRPRRHPQQTRSSTETVTPPAAGQQRTPTRNRQPAARTSGKEANEKPPSPVASSKHLAAAESGRAETSREFAKRIRRVVLHGPRGGGTSERRGGWGGDNITWFPSRWWRTRSGSGQPRDPATFLTYLSENPEAIDLQEALRDRYGEDQFFKRVLDAPRTHKNFRASADGLVFLHEKGRDVLCVPDVLHGGRGIREIVIHHAHTLLAHLGSYKTLSLLRDHVWWKTMAADVRRFCDTCQTCKRTKPNNQRPYGELHTLTVPTTPWEVIGIDFVGPLPESKDRDGAYDSIAVVIDHLTGMVHLVPCRTTYTAKQVAELVFAEVYRLHGMPRAIVSDRDSLFTSTFWTHLHRLVGVELRMSSAYHPETDGATERANRTVTQMLRQCVGNTQKDWVSKLPAIEFAINLARSDTTGYAPFFLNTGRMPRPMLWNDPSEDEFPGVRVYAQRVKQAVMAAHDSILAARVKQTRDANRKRRPAPFVEGDLVYVSTKNISLPKGLARKLAPKYIGPYRITKDFGNYSYRIDLPRNLRQRGVHDVFHASLLRVHEPSDDRLFPGRLEHQVADFGERSDEWVIERVITHQGRGEDALFEVLWRSGDRTWVPYSDIRHVHAMGEYFEALGVENIGQLPPGSGQPPKDDPQIFLGNLRPVRAGRGRGQFKGKPHPCPVLPRKSSRLPSRTRRLLPPSLPRSPPLTSSIWHSQLIHRLFLESVPFILHALLLIMVFTRHSFLERLPNNHLVLRSGTSGHRVQYTPEQVRLYSRFDRAIRLGRLEGAGHLSPAGYAEFRDLWAQDDDCPYQFSRYDAETGASTAIGVAIDVEDLAPVSPRVVVRPPDTASSSPSADPRYDSRKQSIVDDLIFDQLDRSRKAQAAIRARQEAKRSRAAAADDDDFGAPAQAWKKKKLAVGRTSATVSKAGSAAMDVDRDVAGTSAGQAAGASSAASGPLETPVDEEDELVEFHTDDEAPLAAPLKGKGKAAKGKGKAT
ncbi:hypothetical protein ONZ51_g7961 [Trametes cubensis]|uniref:RNA-directed DNA polymerase n=1 Tax=Trametes cubensis TaxID=1111947 RepID=A0AAD7X8P5_9APHY|nr:hypothetical protein ONZ51_g7961 [Trametes cubensis]